MTTRPYCSTIAREAREPLAGTASHARGCVLFSYPKRMWARQALDSEGLPTELVARFSHLAREQDVVTRFIAHEGPWREHVEITLYPQARRHRDVPLADAARLLATARPDDGEALTKPLIAVCTHGVRDRCCALFGLEIVHALRSHARGDDVEVREASHLGGDRFAPTAIVLPSGHTYGHLDPADAGALLDAACGGAPLRDRFRGSLWRDPLEQLADVAALAHDARVASAIETTDHDASHATLRFTGDVTGSRVGFEVRCKRERRLVIGDCRNADAQRHGSVSLWAIEHVSTTR